MAGSGAGGSPTGGSFSTSFTDISQGIFGTDSTGTQNRAVDETVTEKTDVDKIGILKYIQDALSGTEGLAQIFGQESAAGLFGGSGAKIGTEDLLAKIAGEIAKITATKTSSKKGTIASTSTAESGGLQDQISNLLGGTTPGNILSHTPVGGVTKKIGGLF